MISEPIGGAHRDPELMGISLRKALVDSVRRLVKLPVEELLSRRAEKLAAYGRFVEVDLGKALGAEEAAQAEKTEKAGKAEKNA